MRRTRGNFYFRKHRIMVQMGWNLPKSPQQEGENQNIPSFSRYDCHFYHKTQIIPKMREIPEFLPENRLRVDLVLQRVLLDLQSLNFSFYCEIRVFRFSNRLHNTVCSGNNRGKTPRIHVDTRKILFQIIQVSIVQSFFVRIARVPLTRGWKKISATSHSPRRNA